MGVQFRQRRRVTPWAAVVAAILGAVAPSAWGFPGIHDMMATCYYPRIHGRSGNGLLLISDLTFSGSRSDLKIHDLDERGVLRETRILSDGSYLTYRSACTTRDGGLLMMLGTGGGGRVLLRLTRGLEQAWAVRLANAAGVPANLIGASETPDGGFWLLGGSSWSDAEPGLFLIRLGPDGSVLRATRGIFPQGPMVTGSDVVTTSDGGAAVLSGWGTPESQAYIAKFGPDGMPEWQRGVLGPRMDFPLGLAGLADGTILSAIETSAFSNYDEPMLVRFSLDGTLVGLVRTWIGEIDGRPHFVDGRMLASPDGTATFLSTTRAAAGPIMYAFRVTPAGDIAWSGIHEMSGTLPQGAGHCLANDGGVWFASTDFDAPSPLRIMHLASDGRAGDACPPAPLPLVPYLRASPFVDVAHAWRAEPVTSTAASVTISTETPPPMLLICDGSDGLPPAEVSPPGAVAPLLITSDGRLTWEPAAASHSDSFELFRTELAAVGTLLHDCLLRDVLIPEAVDVTPPPAAGAWAYLVRGVNPAGKGPLGRSSTGLSRIAGVACP